ncbi:uncharacterized protein I303_104561 [Kwoniella dejecticola CBS 10117]|uniref:Uncharacterized protein n=1 Tax=Kwoniella dejecticola CBS 10117 TaxID=1296121 RepID=A0A1A6A4Y6_9TREE|nr:uncharacterized protein I303_04462 [Kwoniella dejecticola CBS 10117]OBR85130.1 hypothetical protein I303_04462 [Kwoniella dejecticola CBS 10117]
MGKQHDDTNVSSYKAQNDGHETSSSHVPSEAQGRGLPAQAAHSGDVAAHQHDLKKAQNALHEGLKPKDEIGNRVESGAQNANT